MTINFIVPGEPQGKQRPRLFSAGKKTFAYTPKKTVDYENLIKQRYLKVSDHRFEPGIPVEIYIFVFYKIPKSASKEKTKKMLAEELLPTKKPDLDNVIKVALDALNGVSYHDDSQVVKVYSKKMYSQNPRLEIKIKERK